MFPTGKAKFTIVRPCGFCCNARGAMETIDAALKEGRHVYLYGELLHNPRVSSSLSSRGANAFKSAEDVSPGDIVVLPAHGAPRGMVEELTERGVIVRDATCPVVRRAQNAAAQFAKTCDAVLIAGAASHAETRATLTYAAGKGRVITSAEEIMREPTGRKIGLIAQTTFDEEMFERMKSVAKDRFPDVSIMDTICPTAGESRRALARAAEKADIILVIGGRNSANTRRLAETGEQTGRRVVFVESAMELCAEKFAGATRIAVTAGTSTPHEDIEEARQWLREVFGADEDE